MSDVLEITAQRVHGFFRVPGPDDDKYSRGVVQFVTGSEQYPGAAVLGIAGAFGIGPGMVRYAGAARTLVLTHFPEVVCQLGRSDVSVIGSGWGEDLVEHALQAEASCVVLDAGAMEREELRHMGGTLVLTPHHGEAARLLHCSRSEVTDNPLRSARALQERFDAIIVLKGSATWVVGEQEWCFEAPSHWAATAGAGDVLAGAIGAAIAASPTTVEEAVVAAVWAHGSAAYSTKPMRAMAIADELPAKVEAIAV